MLRNIRSLFRRWQSPPVLSVIAIKEARADMVFFRDGEAIGDGMVVDHGEGAPCARLTPRPAFEAIRPAVRDFIEVVGACAATDDGGQRDQRYATLLKTICGQNCEVHYLTPKGRAGRCDNPPAVEQLEALFFDKEIGDGTFSVRWM